MTIQEIVSKMTLEEKAGMCSGKDFWFLKAVERLGVPSVMVSDGPHGLRKQDQKADHLGINKSIKAVCFPAACATACSFDRNLLRKMGEALGEECQAENVSVILGPAANMKRSPLCGRNFEYFSEDPYLSSEVAAGFIQGVQSKNVGTSLKHFCANNQEHRRMSSSSEIDERTLREIYLASFEGAVKQGKPWTVMCSYNKVNGEYASENKKLLTDVLRDEWGFDGFVMSDWGAVNNRVKGLKAGLELEMPSSGGINDKKIVEAVKDGSLDESILNRSVERILKITFRYLKNRDTSAVFDHGKHHELAREIESECIVLLKNEGILPLKNTDKIAFIGEFAETPRYQGGGSSHINASKVLGALEAVRDVAKVTYAQGYCTDRNEPDEAMISQAVQTAKAADVAVIFVGLPDSFESEGFDRTSMAMPECQNRLIEEICKVQKKVVVVLHNGSPVEMPWADQVQGIVEAYLGGQAVGGAEVDVLFGRKNPCGKLAETFPVKLEDNPSYLYYLGEGDKTEYREGVFVGYRYYEKKKAKVLFPFGHGLSYTTFAYSGLHLDKKEMKDTETLNVSVKVKNTGTAAGKEIVQLYVKDNTGEVIRPVKELKNFAKIALKPGEEKEVTMPLEKRAFAYYNTQIHDWHVADGDYEVLVGSSSSDIRCGEHITVHPAAQLPVHFDLDTTLGDILARPEVREIALAFMKKAVHLEDDINDESLGKSTQKMSEEMNRSLPLHAILNFGNGAVSEEEILQVLDQMNQICNPT